MNMRLQKNKAGWSLIELTIILIVLSIICAILAPVIKRYVDVAKIIRAREDVQMIGCAVMMCLNDTAMEYFHLDGNGVIAGAFENLPPALNDDNRAELLIGDGDVPAGTSLWSVVASTVGVDTLENHLVVNEPSGLVENRYRTVIDLGITSEFAWRGPYITGPIDPDPWGNRYGVSVAFLDPDPEVPGADVLGVALTIANQAEWAVQDTVVLSAGPDETADTLFYQVNGIAGGWIIANDDIGFTVSGGSY